ncbi:TIGR03667 family PPOX class F420-dependent oxidoreductase [Saccharothrix variisporea]|uniref:PPOX class probable F420-dependent enzyme n=1 Tax=Saccharothrix variisporea TaxID=543527 RepID=A0A495X796_9PSEU|nr:TIGR03667 family PPOX class F420-dependent oxidoreductase [Saccharothrix variisporea]RKT68824.1 PPOX class probable F420-dependent enzyme [Saccharothrix variisporea]
MSLLPDPSTALGARVARDLSERMIGWITSVDRAGTPQPAPVWFLWHEDRVLFYSQPSAKRLERIKANPRASFHLNDEGLAHQLTLFTGTLAQAADVPPAAEHPDFLKKYEDLAIRSFGSVQRFSDLFNVAFVFTPEKARMH